MIMEAPIVTNAGIDLQIRALAGEQLTFTRFKIGNGELSSGTSEKELIDLLNPLIEFGISSSEIKDGFITLEGFFDSSAVTDDFKWTELGLFAQGAEGDEVLFAYANDGDNAGFLRTDTGGITIEQTIKMVIAIGEAENVVANLTESMIYLSKEEFKKHEEAENPHNITAKDVGLGNVPNVPTNDQIPTFAIAEKVQNIASGEKLSVIMGKIAAVIKSFLAHISTDTVNPHKLKAADVGAAASTHTHSATDINSGALGVLRGGTGASDAKSARENLGITPENIGAVDKTGDTLTGPLIFNNTDNYFALEKTRILSDGLPYKVTLGVASTGESTLEHYYNGTVDGRIELSSKGLSFKPSANGAITWFGRIQTGSYTGTGQHGSSNKNSLTFSFEPKIVFVQLIDEDDTDYTGYVLQPMVRGSLLTHVLGEGTNMNVCNVDVTWDGNTVSWYSGSSAYMQMNRSGFTYGYVAIG